MYMSLGKVKTSQLCLQITCLHDVIQIHWFIKINIADYKHNHESALETYTRCFSHKRVGPEHKITMVFQDYNGVSPGYTLSLPFLSFLLPPQEPWDRG